MKPAPIYALFLLISKALSLEMCRDNEPCCRCRPTYGMCTAGDEDLVRGCAWKDISCTTECPGKYAWKELYNKSRAMERELHEDCKGDPTKLWPPAEPGGRYAVAFAGGMRNFLVNFHSWQINLIDASGGGVDMYFHVWGDQSDDGNGTYAAQSRALAKSHPNTKAFVDEPFGQFRYLLDRDLPKAHGNHSWLIDIEADFPDPGSARPFRVEAGYSQWRKVYLCLELIRNSGIKYSVILRARPDAIMVEPFDLRFLECQYGGWPSVRAAKGHWITIPERSMQIINDHFAIGTPEAMYEYAKQAFPYTVNCCESYVWQNLEQRCFARSAAVLREEFSNVEKAMRLGQEAEMNNARQRWKVVPNSVRRNSLSPIILTQNMMNVLGKPACTRHGGSGSKCIPVYRTRHAFLFRANVAAWFTMGALCVRYANEGEQSANFMVDAGLGYHAHKANKRFRENPCIKMKSLAASWSAAHDYINSLDSSTRAYLIGYKHFSHSRQQAVRRDAHKKKTNKKRRT